MEADQIKPISEAASTNATPVSDDILYNDPSVQYNASNVLYGGVTNNGQILPSFESQSVQIKPIFQ